jgi:hypothetical protein
MAKMEGVLADDINKFSKAIKRLEKISLKSSKKIILNASETFIISAAKATPIKGKIPVKKYRNEVFRAGKKRGAGWKFFYKEKGRKKMRAKWYKNKSEANKNAKIEYRGISKAGWFLGLPRLKLRLTNQHRDILKRSPKILSKMVNSARIRITDQGPVVRIDNSVRGISRYARISERVGYQMAEKRINLEKNQIHRDLYKSWQA